MRQSLLRKPLKYPKWSYVEANDQYFLILTRTRKKFISIQAFISWETSNLIGTDESLSNYPQAGKVGYRPGSILVNMSNSFYYVEDDLLIRRIADPRFFSDLGFREEDAWRVSDKELAEHKEGESISLD